MAQITDFFGPDIAWSGSGGENPEMIFSTRARFARNLAGFPFPRRSSAAALSGVRSLVFSAVKKSGFFPDAAGIKTESLSAFEKKFLAERHHIAHDMGCCGPAGAVIARDESLCAAINDLDHIRVQSIVSGLAVEDACLAAKKIERAIGGLVPYAHSDKFGYLSACPCNAGTGLRVSCLVHLPALARLGRMPETLEGFSRSGVAAKGIAGAGTCVLGDFYQISNTSSLGAGEEQLAQEVSRIVKGLIIVEAAAREALFKCPEKNKTEDVVWRAYGALSYARTISYQEFMQHMSLVRLGTAMGCRTGLDIGRLNQLTLQMQPAHVQARASRALPPAERDILRAKLVRGVFSLAGRGALPAAVPLTKGAV